MNKILIVFGTRPEAIKMAPLIKAFQKERSIETKVCVTAQHREMLDQVLDIFNIIPEYDLDIMREGQDLYSLTSRILLKMKDVLIEFNPDMVFVHGDTTTTSTTALAAFYQRVKVVHIEAGLRTHDINSPWPEEANRQITGILASYHFTPTQSSFNNLIEENKNKENIFITGNTVIDSLFFILNKITKTEVIKNVIIESINLKYKIEDNKKIILVTGHRRESFGKGFINICNALKKIALNNPSIDIVYPVHLNPNVQKPVKEILGSTNNIYLINPLKYEEFLYLMSISYLIVTDSGGIQEEAPSLGKPVLVMRNTTERPEAIDAGTVKLIGTSSENIRKEVEILINNEIEYTKMSKAYNPYGDGKASDKIVSIIKEIFEDDKK